MLLDERAAGNCIAKKPAVLLDSFLMPKEIYKYANVCVCAYIMAVYM